MKELLKQRVMERLNFSQEISDEYLKEVIQQEIVKVSQDYPMLLSDKIRLNQEVFYALRKLDILQDLLEDDSITEIMINGAENIFIEQYGKLHRYPGFKEGAVLSIVGFVIFLLILYLFRKKKISNIEQNSKENYDILRKETLPQNISGNNNKEE